MMHVPGKANNLIAGSDGAMVTVRDDTGKDCCPHFTPDGQQGNQKCS